MRAKRKSQQGNILFPVVLMGLVISLTLGGLLHHSMVVEQVAIENRLAEMRSYWMTMGHFRYALSRTRDAHLCPVSCSGNQSDATKATVLQNYLNEISAYRTFTYPEENSGYSIKIDLAAAVDDDLLRHNFSGHLMVTSSYPTSGVSTLGILNNAPNRFMPYQLRFCAGLGDSDDTCGTITANNGGNATGYVSVKRFYRLNSVS